MGIRACEKRESRKQPYVNPTARYDSSIQHEKRCNLLKACYKSTRQMHVIIVQQVLQFGFYKVDNTEKILLYHDCIGADGMGCKHREFLGLISNLNLYRCRTVVGIAREVI